MDSDDYFDSNELNQNKWTCVICMISLVSQNELTIHYRGHNNALDHLNTCCCCGKQLSSASSLDRHMLIHSGERPFQCTLCNMTFTTNGNMNRHLKSHTNKDLLSVNLMRSSIKKRKSGIKRLQLKQDLALNESSFSIKSLDVLNLLKNLENSTGFDQSQMVNSTNSIESALRGSKREFEVDDNLISNQSKFKKKSNQDNQDLTAETLVKRTDQINQSLKDCLNSTYSNDLTQTDLAINGEEIKLLNLVLNNSTNGDDLRTENSSKSKRLYCKICKSEVKSERTLRRHLNFHQSGAQLLSCDFCAYKSLDSSSLNRHLRTHNGERPYQCKICKFTFTTKANCERHVRKKHKNGQELNVSDSLQFDSLQSANLQLDAENLDKSTDQSIKKRPIRPTSGFVQVNSISSSDSLFIPHSFYEPSNQETVCKYCNEDFNFNRILKQHLKKFTTNSVQMKQSNSMVNLDELSSNFEMLNEDQQLNDFSEYLLNLSDDSHFPLDLSQKNDHLNSSLVKKDQVNDKNEQMNEILDLIHDNEFISSLLKALKSQTVSYDQ